MTTTIGERIAHIRGVKSQATFAAEIGVHKNSIGNYERGERTPDAEFLERLMQVGYSANWVISGIGPMRLRDIGLAGEQHDISKLIQSAWDFLFVLGQDTTYELHRGGEGDFEIVFPENAGELLAQFVMEYGRSDNSIDSGEYAYIPLFNIEASAGHGSYVDSEDVSSRLAFRRDWINKELHAIPSNMHLIYVRGDSMEPVLEAGDVVMVDTSAATESIRDGIHVIQIDGSVLIKRLQRLIGTRIRVMSDNSMYPSFEADLQRDEITIIGRVIWHAGRV